MTARKPVCGLTRCGSADGVRLFPVGFRCRACTPSALAGQPEPVVPVPMPRPAGIATAATPEMPGPVFGWRSALGLTTSREQARAAWNTPWGPCARCGGRCRRYGEGGNPLCPACRGAAAATETERTAA